MASQRATQGQSIDGSAAILLHSEDIRLDDYPYDSKTTGLRSWRRTLVDDAETGVSISVQRHPAGDSGKWHTHRCGHGMYVLSGVLDTNFGQFGPGSFVWFRPGVTMRHGAPQDNELVYLFVTDGAFNIDYLAAAPGESETAELVHQEGATLLHPEDLAFDDSGAVEDNDAGYSRHVLFEGGPTNMRVELQHFDEQQVIPERTYAYAQGAWVLHGVYHTNYGDFGEGSFVWLPEGAQLARGSLDAPCDLLFIANKQSKTE